MISLLIVAALYVVLLALILWVKRLDDRHDAPLNRYRVGLDAPPRRYGRDR